MSGTFLNIQTVHDNTSTPFLPILLLKWCCVYASAVGYADVNQRTPGNQKRVELQGVVSHHQGCAENWCRLSGQGHALNPLSHFFSLQIRSLLLCDGAKAAVTLQELYCRSLSRPAMLGSSPVPVALWTWDSFYFPWVLLERIPSAAKGSVSDVKYMVLLQQCQSLCSEKLKDRERCFRTGGWEMQFPTRPSVPWFMT